MSHDEVASNPALRTCFSSGKVCQRAWYEANDEVALVHNYSASHELLLGGLSSVFILSIVVGKIQKY